MPARTRLLVAALAGLGLVVAGAMWAMRAYHTGPAGTGFAGSDTSLASDQDDHAYTNRLVDEKSPYLLLHAHNPVDWYPWGEEAFEKARSEDKPIFLSIGYSTCHWCHVMERESFSDPEIAEILDQHFVSIKVDREERPDVDRVYMTYIQATTGGGGWPMSVFLTPDRRPFFGGTYFPPDDRYGRPGFRTLTTRIAELWAGDRDALLEAAERGTELLHLVAEGEEGSGKTLGASTLDAVYVRFIGSFDAEYGGFGSAPKFPRPVALNFLLRYYARTRDEEPLEMALRTLRAMADGGIHDHIGGGFHRYSTDRTWHVPHFEKMLYDQAQLAASYTDAFQITADPFFEQTARDVLEYVLRDMRGPEGGFYSAEDADGLYEFGSPEHGEGAFYVWTADEIDELLRDDAALFRFRYGVQPNGNVPAEQDVQGELAEKNVLIARRTVSETAGQFGKAVDDTTAILADSRQRLFEARNRRPRPPLDDKVLTAWNGLMISAFARASQVFGEPRYLEAAGGAATLLKERLYSTTGGRLKRRYREGDVAIDGFLSDYAYLIQGLIDLYEASFDVTWLSWARELQEKQDELFWDSDKGGYFTTTGEDPSILVQTREDYDGAEPAGNSVAALNLLRLWQMTDRDDWRARAEATMSAFAGRIESAPTALPQLAVALDFGLSKPKQIIIAGDPMANDTRALIRLVHERFIPNKIVMLADGGESQEQIAEWLPFIETIRRIDGRATAYICEDYVCKLPTSDPDVVTRLLDGG